MKLNRLLLGDEALAQGMLDAGLSGVYAYPGTPSTEITEYIQTSPLAKARGVHSHWSTNEKTAMEEALGMSFCGRRAMVCMKHVGMNVCADPFVNSAMTGANGALIVVAADDPSMHSSQNEQDSRFYADFAFIPALEPSSQQEAYDMAAYALDFSEAQQLPVMVRMTTRLCHSRANVAVADQAREQNTLHCPPDSRAAQWVLMPANSRRRYATLLNQWTDLAHLSETSPYNIYISGSAKAKFGVVASGIAYNYLAECYGTEEFPFPTVKIGQYPLPQNLLRRLASEVEEIIVLEEGQPFIERQLRGILPTPVAIKGRLDGTLPRQGELTPDTVAKALGMNPPETQPSKTVVARPPALCQGCGHRDVYQALNETLAEYRGKAKVFGDIGCYTLGWLAPFHAINSVVDMGASITMAKGAADAGLDGPSVAVIGDSTFTHSGMTGLLDAIVENTPVTVIISDNLTTGMTGGQDSQGTGRIEQICLGLGVKPEHLVTVESHPRNLEQMKEMFRRELHYNGLSVIISRRECIQTARRHAKSKKQ